MKIENEKRLVFSVTNNSDSQLSSSESELVTEAVVLRVILKPKNVLNIPYTK